MTESNARRLTIAAFIGVVIVDIALLQGIGWLLKPDGVAYGEMPTKQSVLAGITVPVVVSLLFCAAIVSYLRWWKPVVRDDKPVQRWVRIVPILLLVSVFATIDYSRLADQTALLVLLALGTLLLVGASEELMFRGLGVTVFRKAGLTEAKVALWSSVVFGAVHLSNAISTGSHAILQAAIVSVTGYFFYLTRRVAGVIFVPMVIHGLYDFSIFSHSLGPGDTTAPGQAMIPVLISIILAFILLARRKKIEPAAA